MFIGSGGGNSNGLHKIIAKNGNVFGLVRKVQRNRCLKGNLLRLINVFVLCNFTDAVVMHYLLWAEKDKLNALVRKIFKSPRAARQVAIPRTSSCWA